MKFLIPRFTRDSLTCSPSHYHRPRQLTSDIHQSNPAPSWSTYPDVHLPAPHARPVSYTANYAPANLSPAGPAQHQSLRRPWYGRGKSLSRCLEQRYLMRVNVKYVAEKVVKRFWIWRRGLGCDLCRRWQPSVKTDIGGHVSSGG
jgi:hypothetical protein